MDVLAESITSIKSTDSSIIDIIIGKDTAGKRYIWNQEIKAWIPDIELNQDWAHPETAPFLELSGFMDGSANLIVALYGAKHPNLISDDAPHPYYRVNVAGNSDGSVASYEISLFPRNAYLFTDQDLTPLPLSKDALPFADVGLLRTKNLGVEIYTIATINRNPTPEHEDQTTNTFKGVDKKTWESYPSDLGIYISNHHGEVVMVFPAPAAPFDPNKFNYGTQFTSPAVAKLMNPNMINIFTPEEQQQIKDMLARRWQPFDVTNNPRSVAIGHLPYNLSYMVVFAGFHEWEQPLE